MKSLSVVLCREARQIGHTVGLFDMLQRATSP